MRTPRPIAITALLALAALSAVACSGGSDDASPQLAAEDVRPAARDSLSMADLGGLEVSQVLLSIPWTTGSIDRPGQSGAGRSGTTRYSLTEEDGFDRLLLEFSEEGEFPGYQVEYTDDWPTLCTSGARTLADGRAHLRIALGPLRVRSPDGSPTFDSTNDAALPFANVSGIEVVCLENNRLEWVLGVSRIQPFRVLELRGTRRLVVDVAHPES